MTKKRSARGERTRTHLVESATAVFAEKGYHGATMDQIAREAGYSPAALYKYFRNKDDIFAAVIESTILEMLALFDAPIPGGLPFRDQLRLFLLQMLTKIEDNLDLFMVIHSRRATCGTDSCRDDQKDLHTKLHLIYLDGLSNMMDLGVSEGALKTRPPRHYALAFAGIIDAFIMDWIICRPKEPLKEFTEIIVDLFLEGAREH